MQSFMRSATILSLLMLGVVLKVSCDAVADEGMDDHFLSLNQRAGSRFLADKIKKGTKCDLSNNVCPGLSLSNGSVLLECCKKHCRNVLSDRNNCGTCLSKCKFGELCCHGVCTNIAYNVDNCGKCGLKCKPGVRCEYGSCGYA
ncbi:hypothetical protein AMTRI_Chr01g134390 [Amborella trichopoda]